VRSLHPRAVAFKKAVTLRKAKVYQLCLATAIVTSGRLARRSPKRSEAL
jgi:hypothetical protein